MVRFLGWFSVVIVLLALTACAAMTPRSPLPEERLDQARPYGIEDPSIRFWADQLSPSQLESFEELAAANIRAAHGQKIDAGELIRSDILVLSGGGPDGAFGAGLLRGWAARGDRPAFELVTGISTGAIIAVFAFLGPEYDKTLEEIYTAYSTDDLIEPTIFTALTGGVALGDATGFRNLIDRYVDEKVLEALATAHLQHRGLFIGTTNIDASRPVIWNVGAIAASGHPQALKLIRDVVQASSAIPAVFPPIIIPVQANGQTFDEMHVDGGSTRQVALLSPQVDVRKLDKELGARFDRRIHVIINNSFRKPYEPVSARALSIAQRALGGLISSSGEGDLHRLFATALRGDYKINVISVPNSFTSEPEEPFDPVYMRKLYEVGRNAGISGGFWRDLSSGIGIE